MRTRRAKISDAAAIHSLVAHYAAQGLLLPRAAAEISANIGHFIVQEDHRGVVSCLSLESYGADLAEIRSIAVNPENRGRGLGARLIASARIASAMPRVRASRSDPPHRSVRARDSSSPRGGRDNTTK